jgi:hypothetical protein
VPEVKLYTDKIEIPLGVPFSGDYIFNRDITDSVFEADILDPYTKELITSFTIEKGEYDAESGKQLLRINLNLSQVALLAEKKSYNSCLLETPAGGVQTPRVLFKISPYYIPMD